MNENPLNSKNNLTSHYRGYDVKARFTNPLNLYGGYRRATTTLQLFTRKMTDPYLLFQLQSHLQRNGKKLNWNTSQKATKPISVKDFLSTSVNTAFNPVQYK